MAKFCPKCGLPLKSDATVMGSAYIVDDGGPNYWLLGAGGLAVVAIAVTIGWLGGRGTGSPRVALPPSGRSASYSFPVGGIQPPAAQPMREAANHGPSASATYNPTVRWAWNPPVLPAPAGSTWQPAVLPPSNMDALMRLISRPKRAVVVAVEPIVPATPPLVMAQVMPTQMPEELVPGGPVAAVESLGNATRAQQPVSEDGSAAVPAPRRAPSIYEDDPGSAYIYDPVHERWALKPGFVPRRRR
jgi:hypothetical protein